MMPSDKAKQNTADVLHSLLCKASIIRPCLQNLNCARLKPFCQHAVKCVASPCPVAQCDNLKGILKHLARCKAEDCQLCPPMAARKDLHSAPGRQALCNFVDPTDFARLSVDPAEFGLVSTPANDLECLQSSSISSSVAPAASASAASVPSAIAAPPRDSCPEMSLRQQAGCSQASSRSISKLSTKFRVSPLKPLCEDVRISATENASKVASRALSAAAKPQCTETSLQLQPASNVAGASKQALSGSRTPVLAPITASLIKKTTPLKRRSAPIAATKASSASKAISLLSSDEDTDDDAYFKPAKQAKLTCGSESKLDEKKARSKVQTAATGASQKPNFVSRLTGKEVTLKELRKAEIAEIRAKLPMAGVADWSSHSSAPSSQETNMPVDRLANLEKIRAKQLVISKEQEKHRSRYNFTTQQHAEQLRISILYDIHPDSKYTTEDEQTGFTQERIERELISKVTAETLSLPANKQRLKFIAGLAPTTKSGSMFARFAMWLQFCRKNNYNYREINRDVMDEFGDMLVSKDNVIKQSSAALSQYSSSSIESIKISVLLSAKVLGLIPPQQNNKDFLPPDTRAVFNKYMLKTRGTNVAICVTLLPIEIDRMCMKMAKKTPQAIMRITLLQLMAFTGLRPSSIVPRQRGHLKASHGLQCRDISFQNNFDGTVTMILRIRHNKEIKNCSLAPERRIQMRNSTCDLVRNTMLLIASFDGFKNKNWWTERDFTLRTALASANLFNCCMQCGIIKVGQPLGEVVAAIESVCHECEIPSLHVNDRSIRQGYMCSVCITEMQRENGVTVTASHVAEVVKSMKIWASNTCLKYLSKDLFQMQNTAKFLLYEGFSAEKDNVLDAWPYLTKFDSSEYLQRNSDEVKALVRKAIVAAGENPDSVPKRTLNSRCRTAARHANFDLWKGQLATQKRKGLDPISLPILDMEKVQANSQTKYRNPCLWIHCKLTIDDSEPEFLCPVFDCAKGKPFNSIGVWFYHFHKVHGGTTNLKNKFVCRYADCKSKAFANWSEYREHVWQEAGFCNCAIRKKHTKPECPFFGREWNVKPHVQAQLITENWLCKDIYPTVSNVIAGDAMPLEAFDVTAAHKKLKISKKAMALELAKADANKKSESLADSSGASKSPEKASELATAESTSPEDLSDDSESSESEDEGSDEPEDVDSSEDEDEGPSTSAATKSKAQK